jgi:hypothetical protein
VRLLLTHRPVGLLGLAALGWLAGAVALVVASCDLARGLWYTPSALAAAHLVGLCFVTTAIAGALLHLAPNMSTRRPHAGAGPLVWVGGALLAAGLAGGWPALEAVGGVVVTAGVGWLLAGVVAVARGRRGSWPEPLAGLVAAAGWLLGVLVLGLLMTAERRWGGVGIDRTRAIGVHLTMAGLGWAGGLILAMATRMAPMMLVAKVHHVGLARAAIVVWHLGVASLVAGLALADRTAGTAGAVMLAAAVGLFAAYLSGAVRRGRRRPPPAVQHLAAGLVAVVALAVVVVVRDPADAAVPAALLGLVGLAAGVTAGHIMIMVPTMCWVARFSGARRGDGIPPPVALLAPPALGWCEGIAFASGLGLLVAGVLAAEPVVARAGAVALAVSALGVVASVAVAALRPWTAPPGPRRVPLPVLRS